MATKKDKDLLVKDGIFAHEEIYTKEHPISYVTESYEKLIVNLSYANLDQNYKVIGLTSTLAAEGKTTFVVNLAHLIAQKGKKVLILELDLRKPKLNQVFGVTNEKGLTDYLYGKATLNEAIRHSDYIHIDYITAGEKTSAVTSILESKKLKELIAHLKDIYDYVFIDSPPVAAVSDVLYISHFCDGMIFLVGQKQEAKKGLVKEAIETLRKSETPIIGLAMIQVNLGHDAYGYSYDE